ncbi:hypothetical protein [Chitinophaga silvisoli]|uniref:hypothetical protein n=1 Tax=Chitinophaga silvisoli TaxID=2291814 RepID=UPI0011C185F2|nr:hypothetical protein [Chitinophaga silvisoli]
MKRLLLLSLCAPAVLLLSFSFQQEIGVKRVSKHLYTVSKVASKRVSVSDQEEIKRVVAEHYGIKDFGRGAITIASNNPLNRRMGGILDNSIYKDWVSTKFIFWKQIKTLPEEVIKANEIMNRYAPAIK